MGRRLRTNLPQAQTQLTPDWSYLSEFRDCNKEFKKKQKMDFDRRHRTRSLPLIPDGSEVWVRTHTQQPIPGRVTTQTNTPTKPISHQCHPRKPNLSKYVENEKRQPKPTSTNYDKISYRYSNPSSRKTLNISGKGDVV